MMDADDQDKLETEPADEQENDQPENQPEVETVAEIVPPPRIVAEIPIGGKGRPAPMPRHEERQEPTAKIEAAEGEPEPQAVLPAVEPEAESPDAEAPVSDLPESTQPEAAPAEPEIVEQPPPARSTPSVVSTSEVDAARADDWDDDISPELAALLFQPSKTAPREKAAAVSETAVEGASAAESAPTAESLPPAEPIHLTQIEEARTLPIAAQSVNAPAPHIHPEGKARYERIEEPLEDDAGQRTHEQWDYLDSPELAGRTVKRIVMDETAYTDGSWYWHFERSYKDGERETREVRANTDHTYIERVDVIKSKDATTGKQVKRTEREAMILAGPLHEEKRGLLSSLLGRGDGDDKGPKAWRAASDHEAGRARKEGGLAFKRKSLGLF